MNNNSSGFTYEIEGGIDFFKELKQNWILNMEMTNHILNYKCNH